MEERKIKPMVEITKGLKFPLKWLWIGAGILILIIVGLLLK